MTKAANILNQTVTSLCVHLLLPFYVMFICVYVYVPYLSKQVFRYHPVTRQFDCAWSGNWSGM
jgi:hypothetical protein